MGAGFFLSPDQSVGAAVGTAQFEKRRISEKGKAKGAARRHHPQRFGKRSIKSIQPLEHRSGDHKVEYTGCKGKLLSVTGYDMGRLTDVIP